MMQSSSNSTLEQRMTARLKQLLPPPPTDWVEPVPEPFNLDEIETHDMTQGEITTWLLAPGVIGLPQSGFLSS
jgi:hypothetical protein